MAAKFEIVAIMSCPVSIKLITDKLAEEIGPIQITHSYRLNNWCDIHEKPLCTDDLEGMLDESVIVLQMRSDHWGHMGLSVERCGLEWMYNVWIDTITCPELDKDFITKKNEELYTKAVCRLLETIRVVRADVRCAAMGVEIDVSYAPRLKEQIQNSRNVTLWYSMETLTPDVFAPQWTYQRLKDGSCIAYRRDI